ncbi:MAG: DNA polymerase III subunit delta [Patescibacteria group bacterium]
MYYLFYGEDTYSIQEKAWALAAKLRQNPQGEFGIEKIEGVSLTREIFLGAVLSTSLFTAKKLIIIKSFLRENPDNDLKKFVAENLGRIPKETVVLFWEEGVPDKRSALWRALNRPGRTQYFPAVSGTALSQWIKKNVEMQGVKISPAAVTKLEVFVGGDLWRLNQEIQKTANYCRSAGRDKIEVEDVEILVAAADNTTVFNLTDAAAARDLARALRSMYQLLRAGEDEIKILAMIVYQFRNLLIVSDLVAAGCQPAEIAKKAGLHPYVVQKAQAALRDYRSGDLEAIYRRLEQCDIDIKSGVASPNLLLDLLVTEICEK